MYGCCECLWFVFLAWDSYQVLVHRTDDGRLEVDQSTLNLLDEIHDPVQVVSMVGPFRTGKSYLLNSIIKRLTSRESGKNLRVTGKCMQL